MKRALLVSCLLFCIVFLCASYELHAQEGCVLQPPALHIDFGDGNGSTFNLSSRANYREVDDYCPQDGNYALVSSTGGCFGGHWVTLNQDHTGNGGKMLLVNAAYTPGLFFVTPLRGLSPNTRYELAVWIVNVCKPHEDCTNNRPNLRFLIENIAGTELARFSTGDIQPTGTATWLQYAAIFQTPADGGSIFLKVENKEEGGCGNDFAMDDITLRECVEPKPVLKTPPPRKPITKQVPPVTQPVVKKAPPVIATAKKVAPVNPQIIKKDTPTISGPKIKEKTSISLPKVISSRANLVFKQIETRSGEILVELYDNGEIDGDTVTIYHNNSLAVSRAGLSAKPVTLHITVDEAHPHHELVMVANNLGSIPPNTSLMIVTAQNKRYEVFISSTEQKNAKVVIDLRE
ncbi:MAG: hypothetical protein JWP81_730 [Ferruginibacter sp.]|nr:hypothetical protein [Ferruginibacter sp.]